MGYQANYASRDFSVGTKAIALARTKGADDIPRCKCGAVLVDGPGGNTEYDHIIPWWIKQRSGPGNCQAMCVECHDKKTDQDKALIAKIKRIRDRHNGARTPPTHPFPCGRDTRWTKPVGRHPPVRRLSQPEKLAAALARRRFEPDPAEA